MVFKNKRKLLVGLKAFYRQISSPLRTLPNFIVIGTMKSGTSSMFHYLKQHPQISMAYKAEDFFGRNFHKGVRWYRSFFPYKYKGETQAIGEITPSYILRDYVPERVRATVPEARFIILLRNPVDRAYSHFQFRKRYRPFDLTFEEFITLLPLSSSPPLPKSHMRPEKLMNLFQIYLRGGYMGNKSLIGLSILTESNFF